MAPGVRLAGGVSIGQGAFLGIGSAVVPSVHVGNWATVGAGAAVLQDVPPETTVVGVPARCLSDQSEKRIFPGKRDSRRFSA
jgi:acetyltransferase EpsM